jgi:hypothetical protein
MIVEAHRTFYDRFRPYYQGNMLMIGNQQTEMGDPGEFFGVDSYKTLDPDGGDYARDLTGDVSDLELQFDCVMNVGTLEHIWDIHAAFCNAIKMVKVGGYFMGVHPVNKAKGHGIHVTEEWAILSFLEKNGFERQLNFLTDDSVLRPAHQGIVCLWSAHKKVNHVSDNFQVPLQIYHNNQSVSR